MLMNERIAAFPDQMLEAVSIGDRADLKVLPREVRTIVVTGLGGSGIGGTIFSQICEKDLRVPLIVNKDYFLPSFVNENTLVIVSSYSGNTEESVQAMEMAIKKGAMISCISSGGLISEIARKNACDLITIPGGNPPRSCFGYSIIQLFYLLSAYSLIPSNCRGELISTANNLKKSAARIQEDARAIAEKLISKLTVIYSESTYEGAAIRLRQQINENGKMLCWHHVFPEMNHNELVGWTEKQKDLAVLFLRTSDDYYRSAKRMDICKKIISGYCDTILDIQALGDSRLERTFYLVHLGDWISWYLSEIKGIDATEVRVIDFLKNELSQLK